ncbi:hypothetical protein BEP19_16600 [Ammoniphilus oxalaticus]|uniref:Uncharacterized protein n=1 Tax=Ammoniphilus oxalaticus TaxID=66863 RepID=A0A419SQN1_9BACL|nr:PRK06851 family protein [Ammoniphilus oxalaticus]RKD26814.1 hypothetical protein BEP19_16600 [Ammoniphilus oxalaticus]
MAGKEIHYYAGGNTARGFRSYLDSTLQYMDRIFILLGAPGNGKSSMMKTLGRKYNDEGYDVEWIHSALDRDAVEGVIIPALKVGVVDGSGPHVITAKAPGAIEHYINFGSAWDTESLAKQKKRIVQLRGSIEQHLEEARQCFREALEIHDEWEKIYITNMDFAKADEITAEWIAACFGELRLNKQTQILQRYLGAATPHGAADFVPNLTAGVAKRYFIKGRAGSGKSTMLKRIAAVAQERGFDMEVYHCGLDPNSLDMLIFRELGIAIFDSTTPHEYSPDRENDEIIDIYARAIEPGTDEKYAERIQDISARYRAKMKQGATKLGEAKEAQDQLKELYVAAMDFNQVDAIRAEVESEIDSIARRFAQDSSES